MFGSFGQCSFHFQLPLLVISYMYSTVYTQQQALIQFCRVRICYHRMKGKKKCRHNVGLIMFTLNAFYLICVVTMEGPKLPQLSMHPKEQSVIVLDVIQQYTKTINNEFCLLQARINRIRNGCGHCRDSFSCWLWHCIWSTSLHF